MEESQLALLRTDPSPVNFLKLYETLKAQDKQFSAQTVLLRGVSEATAEPSDCECDEIVARINVVLGLVEDYRDKKVRNSQDLFVLCACLGDICLAQSTAGESLYYLLHSYKCYAPRSELHQSVLMNVTVAGLVQVLSLTMSEQLMKKQHSLAQQLRELTEFVIQSAVLRPEHALATDKFLVSAGNFYFSLYAHHNDLAAFECMKNYFARCGNSEAQALLAYYTDITQARELLKLMICSSPGNSCYWT